MASITTRAGKGSPLTNTEVDDNFSNLNDDKIENVSEDTTPQLGGDLDLNGSDITGTGNIDITGNVSVTGTVDGRDLSADGTKLDGIEANADVTDTTNVVGALTAGSNVTIAADGTISSTDTNTTYSAGTGLSLSGTTFNVDDDYVKIAGDTMTGQLVVGNGEANPLELNRSSQVGIEFNDTSVGSRYLGVNSGNLRFGDSLNHGTNDRVFTDAYHPNADKWTTSRTLSLTGDVTGSVSLDGSANASITTTVANDSHTHDTRYVQKSGDTMTGDLTISKADAKIRLYDSTGTSGNNPFIEFDTTANQGAKIELNVYDGQLPETGYGLVVGPSTTNSQWPDTGDLTFSVLGEIYAGSESLSSVNRVFHEGYHPNADKWTTSRTLSLTGDVTGSVSWDGSANASLTTTVANDSHSHSNYIRSNADDTATGRITFDNDDGIKVDTNGSTPDGTTGTYEQGVTIRGGNMRLNIDVSDVTNGGAYLQTRHSSSTYPTAYYDLSLNPLGGTVKAGGNRVLTTGDEGSGNGLDADTVDGQHASAFQPAASELNWIDQATGDYGTVKVDDDRGVTWAGYAIRDDWVFMSSGASQAGIWNDSNNEWAIVCNANSNVQLYYNGSSKLGTASDGINVTGDVTISADIDNVENIYLDNNVYSVGDTDTYFGFHASNQFRIVTGGTEMFEVNDSQSQFSQNSQHQDGVYARFGNSGDFRMHFDGSNTYLRNYNHGAGNIYFQGEDTEGTNHALLYMRNDTGTPYLQLFGNGAEKFRVNSTGTTLYARMDANGNYLDNVEDIYLRDRIYHDGDTDTYMQFPANDRWRVVTGNQERLLLQGSTLYLNSSTSLSVGGDTVINSSGKLQEIKTSHGRSNSDEFFFYMDSDWVACELILTNVDTIDCTETQLEYGIQGGDESYNFKMHRYDHDGVHSINVTEDNMMSYGGSLYRNAPVTLRMTRQQNSDNQDISFQCFWADTSYDFNMNSGHANISGTGSGLHQIKFYTKSTRNIAWALRVYRDI